jgi:acyl transferase domain-containing protein
VCAGAFTVQQGAEIALCRAAVLDQYQREAGGMLSLATTRATAECLVHLAGSSRTALAAQNAPGDVVISGTTPGLASVRRMTREQRIPATPLKARWALHCAPVMLPASVELAKRLRGFSPRPLQVPVFSPILGRHYRATDDLAECLARHVLLPVEFAAAVRSLAGAGVGRFIECGPLRGLARHVQEITAAMRPEADLRRREPLPSMASEPVDAMTASSHDAPRAFALAG